MTTISLFDRVADVAGQDAANRVADVTDRTDTETTTCLQLLDAVEAYDERWSVALQNDLRDKTGPGLAEPVVAAIKEADRFAVGDHAMRDAFSVAAELVVTAGCFDFDGWVWGPAGPPVEAVWMSDDPHSVAARVEHARMHGVTWTTQFERLYQKRSRDRLDEMLSEPAKALAGLESTLEVLDDLCVIDDANVDGTMDVAKRNEMAHALAFQVADAWVTVAAVNELERDVSLAALNIFGLFAVSEGLRDRVTERSQRYGATVNYWSTAAHLFGVLYADAVDPDGAGLAHGLLGRFKVPVLDS